MRTGRDHNSYSLHVKPLTIRNGKVGSGLLRNGSVVLGKVRKGVVHNHIHFIMKPMVRCSWMRSGEL